MARISCNQIIYPPSSFQRTPNFAPALRSSKFPSSFFLKRRWNKPIMTHHVKARRRAWPGSVSERVSNALLSFHCDSSRAEVLSPQREGDAEPAQVPISRPVDHRGNRSAQWTPICRHLPASGICCMSGFVHFYLKVCSLKKGK